jgi:phage protein D
LNGESSSGKTALTDQKKRSWPEGTSIADMVAKIAGEHSMKPAVSKSLADLTLPHIDQIDESDINLLSRVARDFDAIAKPGDGRIVMAKRGESLTASGQPMPTLLVTQKKVSSWRYRNSVRETVGSVVTVYQDLGAGRSQECRAGDGEPIHRIRRRHPNRDAAQRAADAELKRLTRTGRSFSVSMKGDPDAMAEAKLSVAGFRSYIDGEWLITQANHTLDSGGYRTKVEAEPME